MVTKLDGHKTTTWIDREGNPIFELALHGVMISALEDETTAKKYLALAALNKQDALLDFSLVKPDAPIATPRRAVLLKAALQGENLSVPSGRMQHCEKSGAETVCEIRSQVTNGLKVSAAPSGDAKHLKPSTTVPSHDPSIRITARQIAGDSEDRGDQIKRLVDWMQANIEKEPVDVFSALDVLETRKAECQGHAYLFTAFARSLGIPTRVVNGLVYSEAWGGFLYHSWVESQVGDDWIAVDPTFGQVNADATHIKLLEGESLSDLMPLIDLVGKLRIRVLAVDYRDR